MSHTLMSLDAGWRQLARSGRARRALRQWSIAHPVLRGLPDLGGLLERRRDDHAASAVLRGPGRARPRRRSGRPDPAPGAAAGPGPPGRNCRLRRSGRDRGVGVAGLGTHPHLPGRAPGIGGRQRVVRRPQALPRQSPHRCTPIARHRGSRGAWTDRSSGAGTTPPACGPAHRCGSSPTPASRPPTATSGRATDPCATPSPTGRSGTSGASSSPASNARRSYGSCSPLSWPRPVSARFTPTGTASWGG
jgi:hypothetical protein